jgi:hypothetical protein
VSAITIHPCTIANKGGYMDSMKGGDISWQELAGIYIFERRDILHDISVSIATLFPKVSSQAMWMVLCRADVLRAVQSPVVSAVQHYKRFEITVRRWREGE